MIFGVDLSSHQYPPAVAAAPDFDAMKAAGVAFVMSKATEGVGYANPNFERDRSEAHRVGMGFAAYHYARAGNPLLEAQYFRSVVGALQPGEGLALDQEVANPNPPVWCKTWLDDVHTNTTVAPWLYLDRYDLATYDWSPVAAGNYGLWIACPDGNPNALVNPGKWPFVGMKQFDTRGNVPGVSGLVDRDVFYGDLPAFFRYGFAGEAPAPAPAPAPTPPPPPPPAPAPAPASYTVQPGDNLSAIASRFGVSVTDLVVWNHIANPNVIYPGQVLRLSGGAPAHSTPLVHTVRPGETLTLIARNNSVSVQDLVNWNHITNPNLIYPGQKIIVGWS